MTHSDLINRAVIWLKKVKGCAVVLAERGCSVERADAIGWTYGGESFLIECKVSRTDFRADRHKPHRSDGSGFGLARYYMVPAGLVTRQEVEPEWGLLEVHPKQVRVCEPLWPEREPVTIARLQKELRVLVAAFGSYVSHYAPPPTPWECELIGEGEERA